MKQIRPEILDKRDDLAVLCRRYHVRRLEVFGSAVSGNFDPARSDVDLLAEFEPLQPADYADAYFGLLEALERLFGRRVDLVTPSAIRNKYFLQAVNEGRTLIYAA